MSRIGLKPINVPGNVTVEVLDGTVSVKGPKGDLSAIIAKTLEVKQEDGTLTIERPDNIRYHRSQHGLARTLIANMVQGVTSGHSKTLQIHGVGYRARIAGKLLTLSLGFSHEINITAPEGIDIDVKADEKTRVTTIVVAGADKAKVGQVAADIRKTRKPDPYKGKGVRYLDEVVRLRPGKRAGV
ncbi:MAG: 50S ribosomal protein L6 [Fimbriimonadaceae bacterium]|nr:50S ribosomal protein L6 [Fimbriimonadaceae bacterium]